MFEEDLECSVKVKGKLKLCMNVARVCVCLFIYVCLYTCVPRFCVGRNVFIWVQMYMCDGAVERCKRAKVGGGKKKKSVGFFLCAADEKHALKKSGSCMEKLSGFQSLL